jgi:hypothetical protein
MSTRGEALAVQREAEDLEVAARVVRRYTHGSGWEYLVLVEGIAGREQAEELAALLAESSGRALTIYEKEGRDARALSETPAGQGTGGLGVDPALPAVADPQLPDAQAVLKGAVRALGGSEGGAERLAEADNLSFRYRRTVQGEVSLTAHHELLRSADTEMLEIRMVEGVGVDSRTLIVGDQAWLWTVDGRSAQDAERARGLVGDFGPEQLLGWPLEFARLVEADPGYALLRTEGRVLAEERPVLALEYDGPEAGGTLRVLVEEATSHPVRVSYTTDAGIVAYDFSDWRELDTGLVVPFHVVLLRDGLPVDTIDVLELALPETPDEALSGAADRPLDPPSVQGAEPS